MDRIEYEEWALKSVIEGRGVRIAKEGKEQKMIEVSPGEVFRAGKSSRGVDPVVEA